MAHNKVKGFILGTALAFSVSACNSNDNEIVKDDAQKTEQEARKAAAREADERERAKQQKIYDFRHHIHDSVMNVNGGTDLRGHLESMRPCYKDENDIRDLQYEYSLGGVMDKKVLESGCKIIDKMYSDIAFELSKYKIKLDDYVETEEHDGYSDSYHAKSGLVKYPEDYYKDLMVFVGVGEAGTEESFYSDDAWTGFQELINTVIDSSQYGDGQKADMKNKVAQIMANGQGALIQSRTNIEKQYKPYYLLRDEKDLGLSYAGEGEYYPGYEDLNYEYINGKYRITKRGIHVYDSKLKVDFFGDPDATYKLVSVGDKQWQVIKKTKSGKVEKTHVFSDNRDWEEDVYCSGEKPEAKSWFDFEPGENMGVHIFFDKVDKIEQRQKDWTPNVPANVQHQIDSLQSEYDKKQNLQSLVWDASHQADSIARAMTKARFGVER